MTPDLAALFCCPETGQKLQPLRHDLLERLNQQIKQGICRNQAGEVVTEPLSQAWVRQDLTKIYPARHGIPLLLSDESIRLEEPV
jgi:uncharacterized protein